MSGALRALWQGGQQHQAFREGGARFVMGIAPGSVVGRLLRIADGLRGGTPALEMDRELGRNLPGPGAIPHLQPHANAPVELLPPRRPYLVIQDLLVQGMLKAVAPTAGASGHTRSPTSSRRCCCAANPSHTASTASTGAWLPAATAATVNALPATLAASSTRHTSGGSAWIAAEQLP